MTNLWIAEVVEGLLVSRVRFLKIVNHKVAVAKVAPRIAICRVQLDDVLQILDGFGEGLAGAQDAGNCAHRGDGVLVVPEGMLVGSQGALRVAHELSQVSYTGYVSLVQIHTRVQQPTNLQPNGLIQLDNLLRQSSNGDWFLTRALHRHVAVELGMGSNRAMVRMHATRR